MKITNVSPGTDLGSPAAEAWKTAAVETVKLAPAPLAAQPTAYVRAKWASLPYGATPSAEVAVASDGGKVFVRIEWPDDERPNGEFADAAAVLVAGEAGASAATFGDREHPVGLWYWENGRGEALALSAQGPGVFRRTGVDTVAAAAELTGGRWSVVLSGLAPAGNAIGVAVWNGSNDERSGLAAVTPEWIHLD
jgi:DMSO reductase family type II enzyme heme b subunit